MMKLPNILIYGGHSQRLGYKYQGAMLRQVSDKIVGGETIPIVISWTNFGSAALRDGRGEGSGAPAISQFRDVRNVRNVRNELVA